MNSTEHDLLTKNEAALLIGGRANPVSIGLINQLLAKKKLPKVRVSYRVVRIPRQAVLDFINARTVAQRGGI